MFLFFECLINRMICWHLETYCEVQWQVFLLFWVVSVSVEMETVSSECFFRYRECLAIKFITSSRKLSGLDTSLLFSAFLSRTISFIIWKLRNYQFFLIKFLELWHNKSRDAVETFCPLLNFVSFLFFFMLVEKIPIFC